MKKFITFLSLVLLPLYLEAQSSYGSYNPYVDGAIISPSPLLTIEDGGKGELGFNIGNTGTDPLGIYSDQRILLTITLSNVEPESGDPISAIGGSFSEYFSWSYDSGTYSGIQIMEIPPNSTGDINISFDVRENSNTPGSNGFNVNITPSPYQNLNNIQHDDVVSLYTSTTEYTTLSKSEISSFSIFPNPSTGEIMINLVGESGPYLLEIVSSNGSVVKQDVLELFGTPFSLNLSELTPGIYHLGLTSGENVFHENLIISE